MEPSATSSPADGPQNAPAPVPEAAPVVKSTLLATLRQTLRWCLPALLIGLVLRVALVESMPYGYVQYDTSDYLVTAQRLIQDHRFYIHNKRSYLTPLLFSAAFALPVPATITIAIAQHLMGLIATVLVGMLVRMWFRFWRVWIIPITILFSSNPFIIWYEHTIMGEAQFLFFTLIMVVAGTLFARRPTTTRFIWFVLSLIGAFGTRLESKTFLLFAVMLVVLVHGLNWRRTAIGLAVVIFTFMAAFHVGGDRDVSSLVYASFLRFAPPDSKATPEIMPLIRPLQEEARARSTKYPTDIVRGQKKINNVVEEFVAQRFQGRRQQGPEEARIVHHLCLETLEAEPVRTVMEPWVKFHLAIDAWSSYCYDKRSLWDNQRDAYTMKDWMTLVLGRGLTGENVTLDNIGDWVKAHFHESRVYWFTRYQTAWNRALIYFRLPDETIRELRWVHDFFGGVKDWEHHVPGMPFFYMIGFLGMFVACVRRDGLRLFHWAWVATVLGGLYVCCLAGVTNGRFRFVYEPFFFIYFFICFDALMGFVKDRRTSRQTNLNPKGVA